MYRRAVAISGESELPPLLRERGNQNHWVVPRLGGFDQRRREMHGETRQPTVDGGRLSLPKNRVQIHRFGYGRCQHERAAVLLPCPRGIALLPVTIADDAVERGEIAGFPAPLEEVGGVSVQILGIGEARLPHGNGGKHERRSRKDIKVMPGCRVLREPPQTRNRSVVPSAIVVDEHRIQIDELSVGWSRAEAFSSDFQIVNRLLDLASIDRSPGANARKHSSGGLPRAARLNATDKIMKRSIAPDVRQRDCDARSRSQGNQACLPVSGQDCIRPPSEQIVLGELPASIGVVSHGLADVAVRHGRSRQD